MYFRSNSQSGLYQKNFLKQFLKQKLDMCLWNTDAPGGNKVKYGKHL